MIVARQNGDAGACFPIENSDCLIITCTDNKWVCGVKLHRANKIEVILEGANAPLLFVVVDSDAVVITSRTEQRQRRMEIHTTNGGFVLRLILLDNYTGLVIVNHDLTGVKRRQEPIPSLVEAEPLHAWRVELELYKHGRMAVTYEIDTIEFCDDT